MSRGAFWARASLAKEPRKDGNLGNPVSKDLKAVLLLKDEPAFTLLLIPSQKVTKTILTPYPFMHCSPQLNELSQQLEMESGKRRQLEAQNCDLQEELSALRGSQEKLEKSNGQLQEEVACIKALLKTYKTRAASPDMQELTRSPPCASLRKNLKHRSRDADSEEEDGGRKTPQEHTFPDESIQAKLERYKRYYLEEQKLREGLENDLQRARQRLDENNAKLHRKHH
ncbi:ankyrin repeat domain-containing protein 26-like [Anser cygnoides]|uniref:ankyrin repeat domain-containing protein 26-like n=1 Tax=Anser cygnoides TaxID=8845 RepID=UPI0034D23C45